MFTQMILVNNNIQIKIIYIYNNYNNKPNDDDIIMTLMIETNKNYEVTMVIVIVNA